MDPEKTAKFLLEHAADWSRVTVLTLARPIAQFEPIPVSAHRTSSIIGGVHQNRQLWLHPKLIAFAVISIIIGLSITSLIPCSLPQPGFLQAALFVLLYWLAGGSLTFLICWLLRGTGTYLDTLAIALQVHAALYVVASFLTLTFSTIVNSVPPPIIDNYLPKLIASLLKEPMNMFFAVSLVLHAVYMPLALKKVHRFGWLKTAVLATVPFLTIWVSIQIYFKTGIPTGSLILARS